MKNKICFTHLLLCCKLHTLCVSSPAPGREVRYGVLVLVPRLLEDVRVGLSGPVTRHRVIQAFQHLQAVPGTATLCRYLRYLVIL